ncbi:cysteine desulfurase-like protein [Marinicella gelatinilytica]|uniref:cysteine desulfurase-like protein n=1 Tax=Marinicella gelatinilytica TaxID=2996017 RepID=UPI002260C81E|nr:cysteine desulfurase-like protein [Marinicella gelatinilytica]MCX7545319.1 cysteine desulfurase-like protein [Marinicella gelatinilytica]
MLDLSWVRSQFPGLGHTTDVLLDNAGGSQISQSAISGINDFLTQCNVQLGADYGTSKEAVKRVTQAQSAISTWLNAKQSEEVIVGASSTWLTRMLSLQLMKTWQPGDEVIITDVDHEANRSCWLDLQDQGIVIKHWRVNTETHELEISELNKLLCDKTRLVCCTHVSNIYGHINPIADWAEVVHNHGADICVDGVAYAPHRLLDVQALGVDYYFFSFYKTFGPHQAVLYGKHENLQRLPGINHRFIKDTPYRFQPGNVNYELICGIHGAIRYLLTLGRHHNNGHSSLRENLNLAYNAIADYEQQLIEPLIEFLYTHKDIRIIGDTVADKNQRVATVSFIHKTLSSQDVAQQANQQGLGIRYGDFYAVALIDTLGLRNQHGVVRVSLAHYNSPEEVSRLIEVLHKL